MFYAFRDQRVRIEKILRAGQGLGLVFSRGRDLFIRRGNINFSYL